MGLRPGAITAPRVVAPAGAAASLRVHWPEDVTNLTATGIMKFGGQAVDGFTLTTGGAGTITTVVANGAAAVALNSPGVGDTALVSYNRRASWFTEQPPASIIDGESCWAMRAALLWGAIGGAVAGDIGLMISLNGLRQVNADGAGNAAGVIFGPTGPGALTLRARAVHGGPLTVNYTVPALLAPNLTRWATYELRIVSGVGAADPYLVGLVNGQPVTPRYSWTAAAAALPAPNAEAGWNGYMFSAALRSNGVIPYQAVHGIDLIAAETLDGLA